MNIKIQSNYNIYEFRDEYVLINSDKVLYYIDIEEISYRDDFRSFLLTLIGLNGGVLEIKYLSCFKIEKINIEIKGREKSNANIIVEYVNNFIKMAEIRRKAKEEAEKKALEEKAAKEAAERAAKEKAEKEAAERKAKEEAEKKALEEKAAKEAAEKAAKEKVEKEAAERKAKEEAKHKNKKDSKRDSDRLNKFTDIEDDTDGIIYKREEYIEQWYRYDNDIDLFDEYDYVDDYNDYIETYTELYQRVLNEEWFYPDEDDDELGYEFDPLEEYNNIDE